MPNNINRHIERWFHRLVYRYRIARWVSPLINLKSMFESVQKWMAILLLLTFPMQGLSAVLMAFHCAPDGQHGEVAVGLQRHHQNVAHEHGSNSPPTEQHVGDASSNDAGHFCCNHVFTGVPAIFALTTPDGAFVSINQVATVLPPFFRERLLRPPRT